MKVQTVTQEETQELQAHLDALFADIRKLNDEDARCVLAQLFSWFQSCAEPRGTWTPESNRTRYDAASEFGNAITAAMRHL